MAIFIKIFLPFHEDGRSFPHLTCLISYFRDFNFLSYGYFTCLVRVTYCYFDVIIVKGVISLISFSDYSLSVELFQVSLHLFLYWLLLCCLLLLLCLVMGLAFLIFSRIVSWRDFVFCQMLFQHLMKWSCVYFLWLVYIVDYVDAFPYIETSLPPCNEAHLIDVNILIYSWIWFLRI